MHRLSKTLIEVCGLTSHASRRFFLVLSYLTATREAILSEEWNRKMKIKQRKRTVVTKNLRSAYMSDYKTKSVYFKLKPLLPLSYATAEYCLYIFLF